jgi:hypothetical protein
MPTDGGPSWSAVRSPMMAAALADLVPIPVAALGAPIAHGAS